MRRLNKAILIALTTLSFSLTSFAQNISMKTNNLTVKETMEQLKKKSGYTFVFSSSDIDTKQRVNISAQNASVDDVVKQILRGQKDIEYHIDGKKIILMRAKATDHTKQLSKSKVKGRVLDANGEPIIGATIREQGKSNGAITDIDGTFSIDAADGAILEVSYVGFENQNIQARLGKDLTVTLVEDLENLEEVVVVGYGVQKKQDLTGSVVSIGEGHFTEGVTTNAFQMINGKAAGVNVSQTSSAPGADTKIQVRGAGSINSSNAALVVVDGMPGVDASSINPNDIKSIEILKDASAAAIYGTRAANGVVIITTKSGRKGETTIRLGAEVGAQTVAKKLDVLNARQYMETLNALRVESNNPEGKIYSDAEIAAAGEGTNWQDEIFRKAALVQNYQIAMSGGGEKHDYYVGLGYLNQQGLVKASDLSKYNVRANINVSPKELLRMKFNINYTRRESHSTYENMYGVNENAGPINSAISFDPTLASGIDPETGEYRKNSFIALDNPQALLYGVSPEAQKNNIYGTATIELEPIKDLVFTARLGATINTYTNSSYRDRSTMNGLANGGIASKESGESTQWAAEFLANYKKSFGAHKVNLLAGATFEQNMSQYISGSAKKFLSDVLGFNSMHSGDNLNGDDVYSYNSRNRLNGYLFRINYDLMSRYLLTASFRYDGSSRFAQNHKYAFFPSLAAAWRISDEPFLKNVSQLSDMKLRIGYGQLGNQGISNYQTLANLISGGTAVFGNSMQQGVVQARLSNPDLK